MRDRISRFIRSGFGTLLWSIGVLVALGTHLWLLFANYSGLVQAFELQGTDQKPLEDDPFFGWFFESIFLGEANQGHLFAGILVVALAAGFWLLCFYIFRLISLAGSRVRFQNRGDLESVREAEIRMKYENMPYFLITLAPLMVAAWWDIRLFNFRTLAGSYGIETPEEAILLKNISATMAEAPDNFSYALNYIGGWGYLAAIFLTAFFLKFTWNQLKETAITLEESVLDLMNISVENHTQGEPATDENPSGAPATTEIPAVQAETAVVTAENTAAESNAERHAAEHPMQQPESETTTGTSENNSNTSQGLTHETQEGQTTAPITTEPDELVTAVGENEPVRMSEIMTNTERYYRHEDGRYWNRKYYESLHTNENNKEAA